MKPPTQDKDHESLVNDIMSHNDDGSEMLLKLFNRPTFATYPHIHFTGLPTIHDINRMLLSLPQDNIEEAFTSENSLALKYVSS